MFINLLCFLLIQINEISYVNGEESGNNEIDNVIKETVLHIKNGEIRHFCNSRKTCCEEKFISIVEVITSSQTHKQTDEKSCTDFEVLQELQFFINFKESFTNAITIPCLKSFSGALKVKYRCFSKVLECHPQCEKENSTCIFTADGSKCLLNSNLSIFGTDYRIKYIGCRKIRTPSEESEINISNIVTPQICIKVCQMLGYTYAALGETHTKCSCYQNVTYFEVAEEESCLSACSYNPYYSCGNGYNKHVFHTGIKNLKCSESPCPEGTFCVQFYEDYYCLCNETSKEQPKGCYGCLEGWSTTPDSTECFIMINNLNSRNLSNDCRRYHGVSLYNTSEKTNFFLLAFLANKLLKSSLGEANELKMQLINKNITNQTMPICRRIKSAVIGTYPWTTWPSGSYGLPMPVSGCPDGHNFKWDEGFYRQYTEHTNNQNEISDSFHLFGEVTKEYVFRGFCIKVEESFTEWPNGQYCIYKKGEHCPTNMVEGELFWDDEDTNNNNTATGVLPEGMFKRDTQIFYCCTTGEINQDGILLPRERPFYLFPYKFPICQHVIGTESSLEFIQYDIESYYENIGAAVAKGERHPYAEIVLPGYHLKIYYCYYKPIKSCGRPRHHSDLLNTQKNETYKVGDIVHYVCKNGYKNIGDEYDECLPSEHWSSVVGPKCVDVNECTDNRACHVKANCYNLLGSYICKCNPGWVGNGHTCRVAFCIPPSPLENGFHSNIKTEYAVGEYLFFKCSPKYLLIGSDSTVCQENGQWKSIFPVCVEKSTCVDKSYTCKRSTSYLSQLSNTTCSCKYVEKGNSTYQTDPPERAETSNATLVAALTTGSIALFTMILIVITFTLLKWRKRERRLRDISLKSNTSVYADIEEFRLNLKMNRKKEFRRSSCFSTNTNAVVSWDSKPNLPPRISVCKSVSGTKSNSQFSSSISKFRRHSDFPLSESFLLPPNQFLSAISQEKIKRSFPSKQYNGFSPTQDDATSGLTEKRATIASASLCSQKVPFCSKNATTSLYSENNASQNHKQIDGSLSEYTENPYIDMNTDQFSIRSENDESENSLLTDHYGQTPKNTLRISLRHRSFTVGNTDKIAADAGEKDVNKLNKSSSYNSLQSNAYLNSEQANICFNSSQQPIIGSFQHDESCDVKKGDQVLIINNWEDIAETDFSLQLKLPSAIKKNNKDWRMTMEEFSSRFFRYKIRCKLSSGRKRSETNPL